MLEIEETGRNADYETLQSSETGDMKTERFDIRILKTLYVYFQQHPGDPKMSYNELLRISGVKSVDGIHCLHGLRERKWTDFDLTEGAETGLVWLTLAGIRIAKDICRSFEGGSESDQGQISSIPHETNKESVRSILSKLLHTWCFRQNNDESNSLPEKGEVLPYTFTPTTCGACDAKIVSQYQIGGECLTPACENKICTTCWNAKRNRQCTDCTT